MAGLCSAGKSGVEYLTDFQFMEAISCVYIDNVGVLVAGTMIFGAIFAVTYIRSGPIIPFVLFLVLGGAVSSVIAGPLMGFATVIFLLVGGGVTAYAYRQFSRQMLLYLATLVFVGFLVTFATLLLLYWVQSLYLFISG